MQYKKWSGYMLLIAGCLFLGNLNAQEVDPLHKRKFNVMLDEVKDGVPAKRTINDRIEFKNGRMNSTFLAEKYGYKWMRYRINKDSIFTDSTDTEVRYLQIEASMTDETNQTAVFEFVILEWDMDGTLKITKNDKVKKYYDVAGREKGGKPKKPKKPKKGQGKDYMDLPAKGTVERKE